jgi:hypothetical protein
MEVAQDTMGRCSHATIRPNHYDIADSSVPFWRWAVITTIQYRKAWAEG